MQWKEHAWLALFIGLAAATVVGNRYLSDENRRAIKTEIEHRSELLLHDIHTILQQHFDALEGIAVYVRTELLAGGDIQQNEAMSFLRGILATHPGEIVQAAIYSPSSQYPLIVSKPGSIVPSLAPEARFDVAGPFFRLQPIQEHGMTFLRYLRSQCVNDRCGLVVVDLDAGLMVERILKRDVDRLTSNLSLRVQIERGQKMIPLYVSEPVHETAFDWQGSLPIADARLVLHTRAPRALFARLSSDFPFFFLLMGLALSSLAALIAFERSRFERRLLEKIKEKTQELEAKQKELASVIDHADAAMFLIGEDGRIARSNPVASLMFGYNPDEWQNLPIEALLPKGVSIQEESQRQESMAKHKDGHLFPCEITVARFTLNGKAQRLLIVRDIGERKQKEWVKHRLSKIRELGFTDEPLPAKLQGILEQMFGDPWDLLGDHGAVFLVDGDRLKLYAHHGMENEKISCCRNLAFGECLCGRAAQEGKPLFFPHRPHGHKFKDDHRPDAGYLCIPVVDHGSVLAVLHFTLKPGREVPEAFQDFCLRVSDYLRETLQREKAKSALIESERKYRSLVESVPVGIVIHEGGLIRFANPQIAQMVGLNDPSPLIGKHVFDFVEKSDQPMVEDHIHRSQAGEQLPPFEARIRSVDGRAVWVEVSCTQTTLEGRPCILASIQDISQHKKSEERLSWLSFYDELTGLPNRRLFTERAKQAIAIAKRQKGSLAIMQMDLNRFKFINDSLGHEYGDKVLQEAGKRIVEVLRETDTLARMGGDEFAILVPGVDAKSALRVAHKIRQILQTPVHLEKLRFNIDASIGIALFPHDGETLEDLYRRADAAMYHAKAEHTHIHFFSTGMEEHAKRRLLMEQELINAANKKKFSVYYQSQHSFSDGNIIGLEALLRWQHPTLGFVPPDEFIPVAEETGLIHSLTHWLLAEVGRQARAWHEQGLLPPKIAFNISAVQLMHHGLAKEILQWLEEAQARPEWLELEITESAAMRDPETAIQIMRELVDAGMSIAIDDFGTGYSSLAYLKRLPAQKLKIDSAFIQGLPDDAEDAAIVKSTIAMAHAMGLEVIAEGLENEAQLDFLQNEGCDAVQGYLFCKPLSSDNVTDYLNRMLHRR